MSSHSPGDAALTLPETLNIKNIVDVREIILNSINNNTRTTLDITDEAQVDLSFIQLVSAARQHAETKNHHFVLSRPASGGLFDVLTRGGFLDEMTPDTARFWLHQETV
jgi:hypothetical protein